jgi:DNA-binding CsgD family transcriptional regulator
VTPAEDRRSRAERAARYRAAGWSLRQIARRIGVSEWTVRADLRDAPAPLRSSPLPPPFAGDWRAAAERLRAAGHPDHRNSQLMPYHLIASSLSVDERDIRAHFTRLRKRDQRAGNAAALSAGGWSLRQVAAALGASEATVRRDLRRAPVRQLGARQPPEILTSAPGPIAGSTHPDDAPSAAVVPLRRIAR